MTLVLTRPKEFQKPTHLHSHLLFCNRTDQPKKKQKRVQANAPRQCDNSEQTWADTASDRQKGSW
jgi:hypothetical protein